MPPRLLIIFSVVEAYLESPLPLLLLPQLLRPAPQVGVLLLFQTLLTALRKHQVVSSQI